jgi:hypothetical protein
MRGWATRPGWRAHASVGVRTRRLAHRLSYIGVSGWVSRGLLLVARPAIGLEAGRQGERMIELTLVAAAPLSERPQPKTQPNSEPKSQPKLRAPGDGPLGLAGLATGDPCRPKYGPSPKACLAEWAAKIGARDASTSCSKEELLQHHAAFMPKCPWNVGSEGWEWISSNGTRSVAGAGPGSRNDHRSSTPLAAGAAGLGGLHDSVGRLGFNPDHFDRGFGDE